MSNGSDNNPLAGILWMLGSGLSFVGVNAIVRYLGTAIPASESALLRFLFGVVLLSPALVRLVRTGIPRAALAPIAVRGVLHTAAVILWFYAMGRIPLAEVTAIGYLNPIVVTIGGMILFREKLTRVRLVAIAIALIGALIVIRPGFRTVLPGHVAQLGAALFFGLSYLIAKRLSTMMPASALVAVMSLTVTIGLVPFALAVWKPPTPTEVAWLALVAAFASMGHYCMARAFAAAPLTVTQPVTFLQLVWATLLGAIVFHEGVDPFVLLGGGLIIAAIMTLTFREARARRALRRRDDAPLGASSQI